MSRPVRITYQAPEPYESGMVIEEVDAGTAGGWPFQASRFQVPPGVTNERDVHDMSELWLVRTGTGTVTSGDTRVEVGPGDMVFFDSRVPHQVTNTGTEPLRLYSVWWQA